MQKSTIPNALDQALGFNIYRTALLYKRELIKALVEYDLTPEQWQTLVAMWSSPGPCTQSDIVELTLRDKHGVSRMIDRMEKAGWLTRHQHDGDKRISQITPTAKANRMRTEIITALHSHFATINNILDEQEQANLLGLLKKLRARLEDQPQENPP